MNIWITAVSENFEIRAETLRKAMKAMGHSVTVLTTDYLHVRKEKRTEPKEDYIFLPTRPYTRNLSLTRMRSHAELARTIFGYIRKEIARTDLVWVLVPPNSYALEARKLKEDFPSVRIVMDLIDLWPESLPVGSIKTHFPFTLWRDLRDRSLSVADAVVTECGLYQEILKKPLAGLHPRTLYLAKEKKEFRPKLQLPEGKLSLCYLGSINNIVDQEGIAALIRGEARRRPVLLHIVGGGEHKDLLIRLCREAGAEIADHGAVYDPEKKQEIFDQCHYGLNMMKSTVCVGLTMKSIDYLEGGLPLLNNLRGDTRELIRREGFGINVGDELIPEAYDLRMRENARRFFEQHLSQEVFGEQLYAILEPLES